MSLSAAETVWQVHLNFGAVRSASAEAPGIQSPIVLNRTDKIDEQLKPFVGDRDAVRKLLGKT